MNGRAAICDFGEITSKSVLDMFISHISNKKARKFCNEPKEPDQELDFAIAFDEGVKRQKTYGLRAPETVKSSMKSEPVYAVEKTKARLCFSAGNQIL